MLRPLACILVLSFLYCSAFAEETVPSIFPKLRVADSWSFEAINHEVERVYGPQGFSEGEVTRNDGLLTALYVPPFNLLSYAYFKIIGRDSDEVSSKILTLCRSKISMENKISCISTEVSRYAQSLPKFANGIAFDFRTFCAIAANLFVKIFNLLEIRGARADFIDGSWMLPRSLHVVNAIFLTAPSGTVYSYAMDVGNLPGILFPLSDASIKWHSQNIDRSKTVISNFPAISFDRQTESTTLNSGAR